MCGFVAAFSKKEDQFPEKILSEMTRMLIHRGPDDEGFFFSKRVSFGFRRLKIIDLTDNAHQPMFSDDGRYVIVFNGEIYNYREIRKELKQFGCSFKTDSDTEVLLNSYIQWKEKCLDKFIGMFAFVIYDTKENNFFFARDHFGIKPLFIWEDEFFIILISEIKALLPYSNLEPDINTFNEYLVFRSLPGERTMFKGVRNLPSASFGTIKNNNIQIHRYFKLEDTFYDRKINFQEACDETEKILRESVALHLRSDVGLGILLSGGVDSSLLTAIASQTVGKRLNSFSISFDESEYDEAKYQKRVSERYNTDHYDFRMNEEMLVSGLEKSIWHYEHPLNDPNSVATYHLAMMSKAFVTVMLSGEGADESFLGYTKFLPESIRKVKIRNMFYRHPCLRSIISFIWPFCKGSKFFHITKYPPAMFALSYAKLDIADELLNGRFTEMEPRSLINQIAMGNHLIEVILQDEICDLPQWLWRADKMGMAASLEFRVPFCTPQMFILANSIPYRIKTMNGERKAILKKIAEKFIDQDQIYRKKIGFGVPVDRWLSSNGPYKTMFEDVVNSSSFKNRDFYQNRHFNKIYSQYKRGEYVERNVSFLWTYFNLELWYQIFFEGRWKDFV